MSGIAVITARGGSKRIPKKNIRPFNGRPIIEYSVKAALESGIFDEVMVSTDSEEIKTIAEAAGASVPFLRSAETSSDTATTADVLREVLENYAAEGKRFSEMCCLYPTAPFVTADKLVNAHKILLESAADAVMPVVQFSFPPQRSGHGRCCRCRQTRLPGLHGLRLRELPQDGGRRMERSVCGRQTEQGLRADFAVCR